MKMQSNTLVGVDDPEITEVVASAKIIWQKTRKIEVYLLTNTQLRVII